MSGRRTGRGGGGGAGRGGKGGGRSWSSDGRRGYVSREQQADARRRSSQAQDRAVWDRDARHQMDDDDVVLLEDGADMRPAPAPTPLGDALRQVLDQKGWGERLRGASLHDHWADVVGEDLAGRCQPGRLAGGTLVIVVESSRWATQLRYLEHTIAGRVSAAIGTEVREVRIVVGRLDG